MSASRKPEPKRAMVEFRCVVCERDACYGLGWPLVVPDRWYCPAHKPPDFYGDRR